MILYLLIFQFIQILSTNFYCSLFTKNCQRPFHIFLKTIDSVVDSSNHSIFKFKDHNPSIFKFNYAFMSKILFKSFHLFYIAKHPIKKINEMTELSEQGSSIQRHCSFP